MKKSKEQALYDYYDMQVEARAEDKRRDNGVLQGTSKKAQKR